MSKTYNYSYDEEVYQGPFGSIEEACAEASSNTDRGSFWVGENEAPPAPEPARGAALD